MKNSEAMKNITKRAMLLLMILVSACTTAAGADETSNVLGTGKTCINMMIVTSVYDYATDYEVYTDESNLLDALLGVGLIQGEEVSWGFNVTTVNGIRADYENNGEYWEILYYVKDKGHFPIGIGIGDTPIQNGDYFTFSKVNPFEESEDW